MVNCDDMAQVFKSSKKFSFDLDMGIGQIAVGADIAHAQLPSDQVMSMRAMVLECRLWARGEPGHDADHLSTTMLQYAGVYVAAPTTQQMADRFKIVEEALKKLNTETGHQLIVVNEAYQKAIAILSTQIYADPRFASTIVNSSKIDNLERLLFRNQVRSDDAQIEIEALNGRVSHLEVLRRGDTQSDTPPPLPKDSTPLANGYTPTVGNISGNPRAVNGKPAAATPAPAAHRESVYFATNVSLLSGDATSDLAHYVEILHDHDLHEVDVIGFADSRGSGWLNARLSLNRARQVAAYLERNGLQVRHILAGGETTEFGNELMLNRTAWVIPIQ
jgi:outer membrane protein OmpA-like peptidoglycan-associated protein